MSIVTPDPTRAVQTAHLAVVVQHPRDAEPQLLATWPALDQPSGDPQTRGAHLLARAKHPQIELGHFDAQHARELVAAQPSAFALG